MDRRSVFIDSFFLIPGYFHNAETDETAWELPFHTSILDLIDHYKYAWVTAQGEEADWKSALMKYNESV